MDDWKVFGCLLTARVGIMEKDSERESTIDKCFITPEISSSKDLDELEKMKEKIGEHARGRKNRPQRVGTRPVRQIFLL